MDVTAPNFLVATLLSPSLCSDGDELTEPKPMSLSQRGPQWNQRAPTTLGSQEVVGLGQGLALPDLHVQALYLVPKSAARCGDDAGLESQLSGG